MRALLSQLGRAMPAGLILRAGIGNGGGREKRKNEGEYIMRWLDYLGG